MSYELRADFKSSRQSLEFSLKAPCNIKKGDVLYCSITIDAPDIWRSLQPVIRGKTYKVTIE